MNLKSVSLFALLTVSAVSHATLTDVGEFTGTLSEGFESFSNYYDNGGGDSSLAIMGGAASFESNPVASYQAWIYEPGTADWGLGDGLASVHAGAKGLGLYNNDFEVDAWLVFNDAVSAFGGYFTSDNTGPIQFTFYDYSGFVIGSASFSTATLNTEWQGWTSDIDIKAVRFTGSVFPVMDDLQAGAVPEPATMAVLGLGLAAAARKRRQ